MDPIQGMVEAFNSRDLNAYLANFARDIVIENGDGEVTMAGQRELREFYSRLFTNSTQLRGVIVSQIQLDSYVVYVVTEEDLSGIELEGYPTAVHCLCIYRIEQGLFAHEWELM